MTGGQVHGAVIVLGAEHGIQPPVKDVAGLVGEPMSSPERGMDGACGVAHGRRAATMLHSKGASTWPSGVVNGARTVWAPARMLR